MADIIREREVSDGSNATTTALLAILVIALIAFGLWFAFRRGGVAPAIPNTGGTVNVDVTPGSGTGGNTSGGTPGGTSGGTGGSVTY